jgi:hypothetical protein
MFGYAVDQSKLDVVGHPTAISPRDVAELAETTGLDREALSKRLGTELYVTDLDGGLSERELEAALAETNPGEGP